MCDDYPEFLNPFAEEANTSRSGLNISYSFSGFKRKLRNSIRLVKKEKQDVPRCKLSGTVIRQPVIYPTQQLALPRSRFQERIHRSANSSSSNPFEEENVENKTTGKRRYRKKAPLPPKILPKTNVDDDEYPEVSNHDGSPLSLSSIDTSENSDNTYFEYNTNTKSQIGNEKKTITTKIITFKSDMEKLIDNYNEYSINNIFTNPELSETIESNHNILHVTRSNDDSITLNKEEKIDSKENISSTKKENPMDGLKVEENFCVPDSITSVHKEDEKLTDFHRENEGNYQGKTLLDIFVSCNKLQNPQSVPIAEFITELDTCNNGEKYYANSNNEVVPIPKQRKNKLSRNVLLGV